MNADPIITIADIRTHSCVKGAKAAFDSSGLDFRHFIANGARASSLKGYGYDALIDRAAETARARERR